MLSRCDTIAVGSAGIGPRFKELLKDLLVHRAPVRQENRLQKRCPSKPVDVVYRDTGLEQLTDSLWVAVVTGGNESGASVAVGVLEICPCRQSQSQDLQPSFCSRIEKRRVLNRVLCVHIRPGLNQLPRRLNIVGAGGTQERRAPIGITRFSFRWGSVLVQIGVPVVWV